MAILGLCSALPELAGLRKTPILRSDAQSLFPGKLSSDPKRRFRAVFPGTAHLSSLRAPALSKLTTAPTSSMGGWSAGAPAARQEAPKQRPKLRPLIGAQLWRRLRNWVANAAFLVDGTQIKRGNYSPDAQLA